MNSAHCKLNCAGFNPWLKTIVSKMWNDVSIDGQQSFCSGRTHLCVAKLLRIPSLCLHLLVMIGTDMLVAERSPSSVLALKRAYCACVLQGVRTLADIQPRRSPLLSNRFASRSSIVTIVHVRLHGSKQRNQVHVCLLLPRLAFSMR